MNRHRPSMLRNAVLAGAAAWMLGSCSLVLEFDECRSNDDCSNSNGEALVCNLDTATCETRPEPEDVVCEDIDTCTELYGDDSICGTAGRCALLTSEECTKVLRPSGASDDEIVWIGSILATSEPFTSAVQPIENAVELAIDDFNSATTLADGSKVGWIACDSGGSTDAAVAAAEHLIENVGVAAIIGPTTSEEVLAVSSIAADTGTFFISPSATAASISALDDSGLVWRTISSDIVQSNAIADRLATMDPPPTSILVLAKNDEYGVGLFEPMVQRLAQQLPGVPTGSLLYPDPIGMSAEDVQRAYATVIAEGFPQQADVIVFLGASEVLGLLEAYLTAWNNTGMPLPRFVASHGAVPSLRDASQLVAPEFAETLLNELEGVSPLVQEPDNFDAFNIRYRVVYSDSNTLSSSPLGYDAAAVTLLGLVAGGSDGVAIASAMPRLASGTAVPLGDVTGLVNARELLVAGESIDISGVSGPLDFDLVTGDVTSDYVGWGVTALVNQDTGAVQGQLDSRRAYVLEDEVQGTWVDL